MRKMTYTLSPTAGKLPPVHQLLRRAPSCCLSSREAESKHLRSGGPPRRRSLTCHRRPTSYRGPFSRSRTDASAYQDRREQVALVLPSSLGLALFRVPSTHNPSRKPHEHANPASHDSPFCLLGFKDFIRQVCVMNRPPLALNNLDHSVPVWDPPCFSSCLRADLKPRMPSPIPLPSSGSFLGPNTSSAIPKMTSKCMGCSSPSSILAPLGKLR